jgi:hypothetical protein
MVPTLEGVYRIVDVVTSPPGSLIAALVKVKPERLAVVARGVPARSEVESEKPARAWKGATLERAAPCCSHASA